jgi:hypothetical protein
MKKMTRISLVIALIICVSLFTTAQSTHISKVDAVEKSGYHKIKLSQEIIGEAKVHFQDLRLTNSDFKEVPYFIESGETLTLDTTFKTLPIQDLERYNNGFFTKRAYSELVVENLDTLMLNELYIEINNAQVNKQIKLSGSEDGKNWFSIKDHCRFSITASNKNKKTLKILDFPIVNYKYIKIVMRDYSGDPIKINKVGFYEYKQTICGKDTLEIEDIKLINNHEAKVSKYEVRLPYKYDFKYLNLQLKGADFYKRNVNIYVVDTIVHKKNTDTRLRIISSFVCLSDHNKSTPIRSEKTNHFIIEIENNDNSPLEIKRFFGLNIPMFLIAKLDDQSFQIELGDKDLSQPKYDLINFKDDLHVEETIVKTQVLNLKNSSAKQKTKGFPIWIIWSVIIVVFGLMFIFSAKMIKEMNNKD